MNRPEYSMIENPSDLSEDMLCIIPKDAELLSQVEIEKVTIKVFQRPTDRTIKSGHFYAHARAPIMGDLISIQFYIEDDLDYIFMSKQIFTFFCQYILITRDQYGCTIH